MFKIKSSKYMAILLLLILTSVILLAGCSGSEEDGANENGSTESETQKPIELKLAHFWPSTHLMETDKVQGYIKAVKQATGGRVIITSYPGETLLKSVETYDGVVNGVADMGISCVAYTKGKFPTMEVCEAPGITYNNARVAGKVAMGILQEMNPKEFQDTKVMMLFSTGSADLLTKTPCENLDDLKGLEIRSTGQGTETLKKLGATPVSMPQTEVFDALSKGVVKGNLAPFETLKGFKFAEVVNYVTKTPFLSNNTFFMVMNLDKWDSLPGDLQQAIEEVNKQYFDEEMAGALDEQNEEAMKWVEENYDLKIITLSEAETSKWIEMIKPLQDDYVSKVNERGLPGQEILDLAKELAEKYNQEN